MVSETYFFQSIFIKLYGKSNDKLLKLINICSSANKQIGQKLLFILMGFCSYKSFPVSVIFLYYFPTD